MRITGLISLGIVVACRTVSPAPHGIVFASHAAAAILVEKAGWLVADDGFRIRIKENRCDFDVLLVGDVHADLYQAQPCRFRLAEGELCFENQEVTGLASGIVFQVSGCAPITNPVTDFYEDLIIDNKPVSSHAK